MTVINRVARLFKADLHGLLDTIEEPELLLKQAIREMEAEQVALQLQADGLRQKQERLQECLQSTSMELKELASGLALCLQQGNDDLARALLRKQLHQQRCVVEYEAHLRACQKQLMETRENMARQQVELERIQLQATACEPASDRASVRAAAESCVITDADVEVALLKAKAAARSNGAPAAGTQQEGDV